VNNVINIPKKPKKESAGGGTGFKRAMRATVAIIVAIIGVAALISSITIIQPGHTGVRVLAGSVNGVVSEGLHFVVPFVERVVPMDNRTVAMEMHTEAVTRDLQAVHMNYIVNYSLNADASEHVFRTIGVGFESIIIRPTVEETIKDITARYSIDQLITERARVSADINSALQTAFTERGFTLERFNIVDFSFSQEFTLAIEAVRIAEQRALEAYQDLTRAEHLAEADRVMARAQADVLRYQAMELTETNLLAMWIERWNGILPAVMTGEGGGFMFNIDLDDINTPQVIEVPVEVPVEVPAEVPELVEEDDEDEEE
jgi:regulator of protease activity HflC (stomatin/prohibitin superfamily)